MKFSILFIAFIATFQLAIKAQARCNDTYANHLIKERFSGCQLDTLLDKIQSDSAWPKCGAGVSAVCMGGCYSQMFFGNKDPECNAKYANAIKKCESLIASKARSLACKDAGAYNNTAQAKPGSPDSSCIWTSRTSVEITCGSGRSKNVCGSNSGKILCSGSVTCTNDFYLDETLIEKGVFEASCLTTKDSCDNISMESCFTDGSTKTISSETIKANSRSSQGAN